MSAVSSLGLIISEGESIGHAYTCSVTSRVFSPSRLTSPSLGVVKCKVLLSFSLDSFRDKISRRERRGTVHAKKHVRDRIRDLRRVLAFLFHDLKIYSPPAYNQPRNPRSTMADLSFCFHFPLRAYSISARILTIMVIK